MPISIDELRQHLGCDHARGICFIVPPHMLDSLAKNAKGAMRDRALRSIAQSGFLRGARSVHAATFWPLSTGTKRRTIYDAKSMETLPGKLVRSEGDPAGKDVSANEAYTGSGAVYDFYRKVYDRNSIDGKGMGLDSTVHYGVAYDNAFWNGQQMVYGDGDGEIFRRFTVSLDVIGHELTHGVTEFEAGLVYQDQPGALNESMSDVFGSLVKQWRRKQSAAKADWIIGEGLLAPGVKGIGLRSMKAPGTAYNDPNLGKDPQPDHMKNLYRGSADNGGVHINSGIPNRAFYLAATAIGGYAWKKAGLIWYIALCEKLKPQSGFAEARNATNAVAVERFGKNSLEAKAVSSAWKAVGL